MHHVRKKNRRKMLKPKFDSSSSDDDDDDIDDAAPITQKPIVASFPGESNKSKRYHSIVTNPVNERLNANMSKQQKLSAEVIQKEEIYNQAEMEANKKMFGSTNPGRCLSKDEIQRRKDIILQIVNDRLKSKLSELMGEFGERLGMNDSYEMGRSSTDDIDRYRNESPDDDDFIPEAPPPPTFNTSSESDDDLDVSMTKEFELYEKEIQEKTLSGVKPHFVPSASSSSVSTSASYNSVQAAQQTSTNYQQNWQPPIQQWQATVPSADTWIPPIGPPQVMEPFLPPMESEQIAFMNPPPLFPTFQNVSSTPGWIDPSSKWSNPPPNTFVSNYRSSVPQYPNPQSAPFRPSIPPPRLQRFPGQSAPRTNWNPERGQRPSNFFNRATTAPYTETAVRPNSSVNSVQSQNQLSTTLNNSIVSKSTYVNAILAAEKKVTASTGESVTKVNQAIDGSGNDSSQNEDNKSRKRAYDKDKSNGDSNSDKNSNELNKRVRADDLTKKTRFDNTRDGYNRPDYQRKGRSDYVTGPLQANERFGVQTRQPQKSIDARNSMSTESNDEPIQWRKLCNIVDKLLDLSPNSLKDLPVKDRRVTERNEILMILSDDPSNFYAHVDKYGENNVKWAVKMAQRILFPQGRYDDKVALALAPFQKAIRNIDTSSVYVPLKQESIVKKSTDKVSIPKNQTQTPKEWKKLCDIVDKLLNIPTRVIEELPPSDSRVRERNDVLMILSNEPEDFLLHDVKYGAPNVDGAILAATRILCPNGVPDERVRKIMLRQREILTNGSSSVSEKGYIDPKKGNATDRSISRETESSRKRTNYKKADEYRSQSLPREWNQLCDIVDKVLDTPKEVRIKMAKRDPRWEQRENMLLILSDDPDKLESQFDELGRVNVDWAIKSSRKVMFPNGPKDRRIFKKLSPTRRLLLRNRHSETNSDTKNIKDTVNETVRCAKTSPKKQSDQINDVKCEQGNDNPPPKKVTVQVETNKNKSHQENGENVHSTDKKIVKSQKSPTIEAVKETSNPVADKEIDEKEVWLKLCSIVDKVLDLPPNAAEKLEPLDKRLIERNDLLMVLSDDPENFSKFESSYGNLNVAWAIKSAKKLIYSNGKLNEKLTDALWTQRNAIMCSEEEQPREDLKDAPTGECKEWICIRKIATKVFLLSCQSAKNEKKLTKEQLHQQIELLLQLSDDPDIVRSKPICKKIGEGRAEAVIARCKHLLNRMRKSDEQTLLNFENLRSKMVLYSESLNQSKNIQNYDVILTEVRQIVDQKLFNEIYGQTFNKWTGEQKLERNELAILLIKDPHLIESNVKYMEMVRKTGKETPVEIVDEVAKCLLKCEYVKEATAVVACPPIIAEIKDEKFMNPFKEKKLIHRIHRLIEQFLVVPKPEVFDVRPSSDGTINVVCANEMTFDFLKKSINELDGLWSHAKLSISRAPITTKVLDIDDLKEIKMMLKTVPAVCLPFAVAMRQLKKSNSKLNTDKWQLVPASLVDPKKMFVMVDLESLVELERSNREVIVESGTVYFDIKYFGKENF